MELSELVTDIAGVIVSVDSSGRSFRDFKNGVGPFGEPQLVKLIADGLNGTGKYSKKARTNRSPDLLIPDQWALEFKITRPFGDNGKEAENWSVNLLHPYPGNVSALGDCLKLLNHSGPERKAVVVIGYEHIPSKINLTPLFASFEVIASDVLQLKLSPRVEARREGLIHPVHQAVRVIAWEVFA